MDESELKRVYNCPIYPRDSKILSERGFVNIDNESQGGTHWTCFIVKDKNRFTLTRLVVSQINFY